MDKLNTYQQQMESAGYVAERSLASALLLMDSLGRPLLLEGDAGVGKTEVGKMLARLHQCELIRLQCYEGLDVNSTIYEWNYQRQLLAIKLMDNNNDGIEQREQAIFSERFLLERPLLRSITQNTSPVLLIDEIDRTDEEFESYLLELLSDFQISIPELGTINAKTIPRVVLTSNGTRELSDALRRRCLYYFLDYPSNEKELQILQMHMPDASRNLAGQIVNFVQQLRQEDLRKTPGIAETLDWTAALMNLEVQNLNQSVDDIYDTLVCLLKTREDRETVSKDMVGAIAAAL